MYLNKNDTLPADPGVWFIARWHEMAAVQPSHRTAAPLVTPFDQQAILSAASKVAADEVVQALVEIIARAKSDADRIALVLSAMRVIDFKFLAIHPRALSTPRDASVLPEWLQEAAEARAMSGAYAASGTSRLVARGPLTRGERLLDASAADSLEDRFSALSVVEESTSHSGRKILISHRVIPPSMLQGVAPGKSLGKERIAFLAVAQEESDLQITGSKKGARHFADFRASTSFDVASRVGDGLNEAGDADICLAPELVVCEEHADAICQQLRYRQTEVRLTILGSGHTRAQDDAGMHWNEARAVNGMGVTLWRQRKLWPASIGVEKAKRLGIESEEGSNCFELNASGDTIEVIDIDSLGRCVVLICQDLHAEPAMRDILHEFQPDWVFVPILDENVDVGRWAHQRAIAYSLLPTRFLLSTNTAYALKLGGAPTSTIGMAMGPQQDQRVCAPLAPEIRGGTAIAEVQWGSGCDKWVQWTISAAKT